MYMKINLSCLILIPTAPVGVRNWSNWNVRTLEPQMEWSLWNKFQQTVHLHWLDLLESQHISLRMALSRWLLLPSSLKCPGYAHSAGLSPQGISRTWGWFWDWFPIHKAQKAPYDQVLSTAVANPTMHPKFWSILQNHNWIHTERFHVVYWWVSDIEYMTVFVKKQ